MKNLLIFVYFQQQIKSYTFTLFTNSLNLSSDSEDSKKINIEEFFEHSIRCAAHILKLGVHDGFEPIKNDARANAAHTKVKSLFRLTVKSTFSYLINVKVPPKLTATR